MPKYDYRCRKCNIIIVVEYPITETREVKCAMCDTVMSKVFSAPAVTFKGKGWGHQ